MVISTGIPIYLKLLYGKDDLMSGNESQINYFVGEEDKEDLQCLLF